jgi:hypothetical protein
MDDILSLANDVAVTSSDDRKIESISHAMKSISQVNVFERRIKSLKSRLFLKYLMIDSEELTSGLHITDLKR